MAYKNKETRSMYSKERPCSVCQISKPKSEYNVNQQRCKDCESKTLRKCCRCNSIKEEVDFPKDKSKGSGISSYCKKCKSKRQGKRIRIKKYKKKVTPLVRLRWMFKDSIRRLNRCKTSSTFKTLGFTKEEYISKFPVIPEGKHLDHCIPLSWFKEDTPISISCNLHNLQLLDSFVNLNKKNIFCHKPSDNQYIEKVLPFIKEEQLANVKNLL